MKYPTLLPVLLRSRVWPGVNINANIDMLFASMFNSLYTCVMVRIENKFRILLIDFNSCCKWGSLI